MATNTKKKTGTKKRVAPTKRGAVKKKGVKSNIRKIGTAKKGYSRKAA